ncbi:transcriptional regulator, partial [Herbaspirillum sp. HC18]
MGKIELLEGDTGPRASRARARFGETPTLIVLPFVNLSSNAQQGYFAQGLSQTISTDLSRIAGLLVISAATASTFEGKNVDVRQVSRELGARYVLTGTVHRIRRNVRINAQLVDGETGFQLWADLFDGYATELHSLQDRITGRIANSIG